MNRAKSKSRFLYRASVSLVVGATAAQIPIILSLLVLSIPALSKYYSAEAYIVVAAALAGLCIGVYSFRWVYGRLGEVSSKGPSGKAA
jgi:hypothetical protein